MKNIMRKYNKKTQELGANVRKKQKKGQRIKKRHKERHNEVHKQKRCGYDGIKVKNNGQKRKIREEK